MASEQNQVGGEAGASGSGTSGSDGGGRPAAAQLARTLVRSAWKGTLGTLARAGGHPYGSLVALATAPDGAPLLLLSGLAEHTRNLQAERRASLLIDGTSAGPAALTGPRVTLVGRIVEADADVARPRYLARHPDAAGFIDFADFRLYELAIEWAHLVAGFGRIVRLDAADMIVPTGGAAGLLAAEASVLQHMNEDHADAVELLAHQALTANRGMVASGVPPGAPWRMVGCDPEGLDIVSGTYAVRCLFPQRVTTPDDVRRALVAMVGAARATAAGSAEIRTG